MGGMDNFFSMFQAFIGIYLLYAAFTGKGQAYKNDNIKKEKREEYARFMRTFCFIMGPLFLASAAFDYAKITVGGYITYALTGIGIVYALVATYRMTERKKSTKEGKRGNNKE